MSLTEILLEEFEKIENETEIRKQEVSYIKELVEKNYDKVVELLDDTISEGNKDRAVYELVKKALKTVEEFYEIHANVIWDKLVKEDLKKQVSFLLGWTEIRYNKEKPVPFAFYPTELGEKTYNGLRKIRGQEPVHKKVKFFNSVLRNE